MTLGELYLSIDGRISRSTLWLKYFVPILIIDVIIAIWAAADPTTGNIVSLIVGLILIWPGIAVTVKRWHDRDKSAWWLLLILVPVIGWLWAFIELGFFKGTDGPNRFGPDPLMA